MVRLFAALAEARSPVDWNIAFGEAHEWARRVKRIIPWVLLTIILCLVVAYTSLHQEIRTTKQQNTQIIETQRTIMEVLSGKSVASPKTTP